MTDAHITITDSLPLSTLLAARYSAIYGWRVIDPDGGVWHPAEPVMDDHDDVGARILARCIDDPMSGTWHQ